jgi:hypothetical protein
MICGKMRWLAGLGVICAGMLLGPGCAPSGYITASVQSVIGLDISENPQTQVPHIRFGFIRNQLYYIPTGKVVVSGGAAGSGEAKETPELVSDIDVDITFLNKTKIIERFAVGPVAVTTGAAKIMFSPKDKDLPPLIFHNELSYTVRKIGEITSKNKEKDKAAISWINEKFPKYSKEKYPLDTFLERPPSANAVINLLSYLESN